MSHKLPLADIKFLTEFHAYCLTRGDEAYNFFDTASCALGQFGHTGVTDDNLKGVPFKALQEAAEIPHRFSALATRLEALLVDAPRVS